MNRTPLSRRTQIINCLVEGNSIRSTERMTGTHRDTIMRLLVEVGGGCSALLDTHMRELECRRLQVDEIWTYVQKKQRHVTAGDDQSRVGDQWTFVAIDADTKLVPAYRIGKRDLPTAMAFMSDIADRLSNRVQLSSDGLRLMSRLPKRPLARMSIMGRSSKPTRLNQSDQDATARRMSSVRSASRWRARQISHTFRPASLSVRT